MEPLRVEFCLTFHLHWLMSTVTHPFDHYTCMMSTTAQKPATTPIPVQLSENEFHAFIFQHLSMPRRGPKCKLGYHRVFHLILWVLYTGMQWKCLPVPQDAQGKPAIHYT